MPEAVKGRDMPCRLDAALLPDCDWSFIIIADTHCVSPNAPHANEYVSRKLQNARVAAAVECCRTFDARAVFHLGDRVQEQPGSARFRETMLATAGELSIGATPMYQVAGNADVGDKRGSYSPGREIDAETLFEFSEMFGRTWYAVEMEPIMFLVINASLLNSGLPEEHEQYAWMEECGERHGIGSRILVMHYPLFLRDTNDPSVGNYDVVSEPARQRVLEFIERHEIDIVVSGHVHWPTLVRKGRTRFVGVPSTSFTRPGFGEALSSAPAPDGGRDDVDKLGLYIGRVRGESVRMHMVRTAFGSSQSGTWSARVLSAVPKDVPTSPLGVVCRHALTAIGEVPVAFPSVVRQPIRNDCGLLGCLEVGAQFVHVRPSDAAGRGREALELVRAEGIRVVMAWVWHEGLDLVRAMRECADVCDAIEVQVPDEGGMPRPALECIRSLEAALGLEVTVTPLRHVRDGEGRELPRWRTGYRLEEGYARRGAEPAWAECGSRRGFRLNAFEDVVRLPEAWRAVQNQGVKGIDVVVELPHDGAVASATVAAGLLACATCPGVRLFVDPLVALDRTLELREGLLDRLCNPGRGFHAARCVNTVLFARDDVWISFEALPSRTVEGWIVRGKRRLVALITRIDEGVEEWLESEVLQSKELRCSAKAIHLGTGMSRELVVPEEAQQLTDSLPILIVA